MKAILFILLSFTIGFSAGAENCVSKLPVYQICADQKVLFADAADLAERESKVLLVIFGADWCSYCKSLDALLNNPQVSARISPFLNRVTIAADKAYPAAPSAQQVFEILNNMAGEGKIERIPGFPFLAFYNPVSKRVTWMSSEEFETDPETQKQGILHDPERMIRALVSGSSFQGKSK